MCKILCISGIKPEFRGNALKFLVAMGREMSTANNDGLGYAAIDEDGTLFSERWLNNYTAFDSRKPVTDFDEKMMKKFSKMLLKDRKYDCFGTPDPVAQLQKVSSITLHTRSATSSKVFCNTHPFIDKKTGTSLIHNGIIQNVKELEQKISTCDSECILNEYIDWNVMENADNIQGMANNLEGYYACGVFAKMGGKYILDIFKDTSASLGAAFVKELDAMVFTTSVHNVEEVCRRLNFTVESTYECAAGVLLRLDALTGDHISSTEFEPVYITKHKSYYNKSGGHNRSNGTQCAIEHKRSEQSSVHNISNIKREVNTSEDKTRQLISVLDNMSGWVRGEGNIWRRKDA